ncbi:hypothetical protein EDD57_1539 [Baia soyae]|uniref:Uncharacterized protein n=1 Tax=Baia soyae TaxID=1544746 RepID=A0A4R2RHU7_9BACL|nr:hypothetical protein EDD57_1539 [Baia soyae]
MYVSFLLTKISYIKQYHVLCFCFSFSFSILHHFEKNPLMKPYHTVDNVYNAKSRLTGKQVNPAKITIQLLSVVSKEIPANQAYDPNGNMIEVEQSLEKET